jgi:hypothetical protein
MNKNLERFGSIIVSFYAWTSALFFGSILLDIVYSNSLKDVLGASVSEVAFSEAADFLLCIGFVMLLAAFGAIAFSWKVTAARNLIIASLLVFIFEFLAPIFFQFLLGVQDLAIGTWLRIAGNGLASFLACTGLYKYFQGK